MLKLISEGVEIVVTAANKAGILADITGLLSEKGVNLEAVAGYAGKDKKARIMLVCADSARAVALLKKSGYRSIKENTVVLLAINDRPGSLGAIADALAAARIDIKQIYGTTCSTGCPAKIVLSTSNNKKALAVLKK
ncbi:MAG: ACT domain-containing protein [Candidatus Omnitrophica bacterium]|nr:ACT domain-containing protein [Candidatus Omnitrophota bacterium]